MSFHVALEDWMEGLGRGRMDYDACRTRAAGQAVPLSSELLRD